MTAANPRKTDMTAMNLQVGDVRQQAATYIDKITSDEIISRLKQYGIMPQFMREVLIDCAIADITLTTEETFKACQQFYQQQQLKSDADLETWLVSRSLSREQLDHIITRNTKLEYIKRGNWENKLESYFLQRKAKLDRVIYSLIRVKDIGIAQELYFRIQEGEQSFSELGSKYSLGAEAETGGLLGPMELSVPHPDLAKMLAASQPGKLLPPTRLGEWIVIVRLEKFIKAQLNESMRQRLLNELFENWIQTQYKGLIAE
ncbi:peptidylprolyl isomerase [Plectonema radiosum NIES-515]|uniref:peptidylprolyl isomerase n=1 Tax=Plectonema radiosum NIES-515 TaxID=2986073 RepID=A0ABT3AYG5_9CYAN|nr:peptidylprolyl isomerase [Plectonema radiosum]MCV3213624.1 peptidylprolyl isomerase [Plectonema radiosum NIES-515]